MKTILIPTACLLSILTSSIAQTVVFEENFNSYSSGNLDGQGGYSKVNAAHESIHVGSGPGTFDPSNTTNVITNDGGSGNGVRTATKSVNLGFSGATTSATLSFEFAISGTATNFAGVSIGGSTFGAADVVDGVGFITGNSFGANVLNFRRQTLSGDQTKMTDIAGSDFNYGNEVWHRIEATLDFVSEEISGVFVTNLDNLATSQLYFGAGNPTLGLDILAPGFTDLYLRAPNDSTGNAGYIDNIAISAIPEPASAAMVVTSVIGALALLRRRRGCQE